jgi:hypothetical protein
MVQAQWTGMEMARTRKSIALERPDTMPQAGTTRWSDRVWAAPSTRWLGMGTSRFLVGQPDGLNSPQIRRISTKENPNSLLLPLPQTPPPPSLPPSLPREHLSRAPPSLILVAPFPPTPRQAPAQPPPLPPSLNPRHARRRPCDGRIQAPP